MAHVVRVHARGRQRNEQLPANFTTYDLKSRIRNQWGIDVFNDRLYHNGVRLLDDQYLDGIPNQADLIFVEMKTVSVKYRGRFHYVEVEENDRMGDVLDQVLAMFPEKNRDNCDLRVLDNEEDPEWNLGMTVTEHFEFMFELQLDAHIYLVDEDDENNPNNADSGDEDDEDNEDEEDPNVIQEFPEDYTDHDGGDDEDDDDDDGPGGAVVGG